MQTFLLVTFLLRTGLIAAFSIRERQLLNGGIAELREFTDIKDCVSMHGESGDFRYTSPGGGDVCGVYLVGDPDTVVDIVFHQFDVGCDDGGLVALVDGWEAKGEFFPGDWDSSKSLNERYTTYCGKTRPRHFRSEQNVALIQHRIPESLQGFTFTVNFIPKTKPCNAISMADEGTWTFYNYGHNSNCSLSMLSPQYVQVLRMDVGTSTQLSEIEMDASVGKMCSGDQLEFLAGVGLDPSYMWLEDTLCGRANRPRHGIYLPCPHSVVRLVSSGRYANKVTIRYRSLTQEEKDIIGPIEC